MTAKKSNGKVPDEAIYHEGEGPPPAVVEALERTLVRPKDLPPVEILTADRRVSYRKGPASLIHEAALLPLRSGRPAEVLFARISRGPKPALPWNPVVRLDHGVKIGSHSFTVCRKFLGGLSARSLACLEAGHGRMGQLNYVGPIPESEWARPIDLPDVAIATRASSTQVVFVKWLGLWHAVGRLPKSVIYQEDIDARAAAEHREKHPHPHVPIV